jgi:hydrogenase nickel incorporation protein HypA/HybF
MPALGLSEFAAFRIGSYVDLPEHEPMHEYSIVQALLRRAESEAAAHGAHAVTRIWVQVGELCGVECDLLRTAYDMFRERTICEQAPLVVSRVPVRWACPRCQTILVTGGVLKCTSCDVPAVLHSGDELILERIEMEVD